MANKSILTEAISEVSRYINDLASSTDPEENSKAEKLAYWLKDYIRFLRFEKNFDPQKNRRYERGDIVKVHLGFNVGAEEGGLHYAVVLDKANAIRSPLLTIVPLTSVKSDKDITNLRDYEVYCENSIYDALHDKISTALQHARAEYNKLLTSVKAIHTPIGKKEQHRLDREFSKLKGEVQNLNKMGQEISRMKEGSIALVSQITTVSKIRICDPRHDSDVLAKIKMPGQYLDKIDEKLILFYIKEKKFSPDLLTKV